MRLLLQHKIFIGYFLLMAVIGCMVAIVLHERKRVSETPNPFSLQSLTLFRQNLPESHEFFVFLHANM